MGKRKDTLELEKALERMAKEKRWYGCEEITIGFKYGISAGMAAELELAEKCGKQIWRF